MKTAAGLCQQLSNALREQSDCSQESNNSSETNQGEKPKTETSLKAISSEQQARVIGRVWEKMGALYGHKWTSSYGPVDAIGGQTWLEGLSDMTMDEIKTGLQACAFRADPWPPSLPEFRALCRPETPIKHACHRDAKPYAALPKPEKITAPGDARAHLASIMEKLGGRCGRLEPRKNRIDPVSADRRAELAAELRQHGYDADRDDAA